jgi:hypothetical protein
MRGRAFVGKDISNSVVCAASLACGEQRTPKQQATAHQNFAKRHSKAKKGNRLTRPAVKQSEKSRSRTTAQKKKRNEERRRSMDDLVLVFTKLIKTGTDTDKISMDKARMDNIMGNCCLGSKQHALVTRRLIQVAMDEVATSLNLKKLNWIFFEQSGEYILVGLRI